MKSIITFLLILFCWTANAQNSTFVRVYSPSGQKFNKGHVQSVSPTVLMLTNGSGTVQIPVDEIGFIKTKRSIGHNILIGSLITGGIGAVILTTAAKQSNSFNSLEIAGLGLATTIYSSSYGAGIGALTGLFKNSETFIIAGDSLKLKHFQNTLNK